MRPFTFLASIQAVIDGPTLAAEARRAAALGFSGLVVPDHMIEQLSPIPALATIAAATDKLRIGGGGTTHAADGMIGTLVVTP